MPQTTAFEVLGKFLLYVQGQVLALRGHHIPECRVVPFNHVIEKHPFRPMTFIGWTVWRPLRDHCVRLIVLRSMKHSIFS